MYAIRSYYALSGTRIIAEAWEAAGLYQVGGFPGFRWAEWNGRYRDVMRRFVRGDKGLVNEVAMRISGNSDLYQAQDRSPMNSINFVTCHVITSYSIHYTKLYDKRERRSLATRGGGKALRP